MFYSLPHLSHAETRSISAENPTGEKGGGGQRRPGDDPSCTPAAAKLGKGWKVRPCLRDLEPGAAVTLADVTAGGVVQHIWCTVQPQHLRALSLRVTYDDQTHPSVETPLGDFFANGIDGAALVTSTPVAVNPRGGMNSYWPMPFRKRLRIEVSNDGHEAIPELYYQSTYALQEVADDAAYLHASWRRSTTRREHPEHLILDGVEGRGHYVGTYLVWNQHSTGWWGEGEVKFYIDDDPDGCPTICGTGTEDYFGGAWGFVQEPPTERPMTYSGPFLGYPQTEYRGAGPRVPVHGLYRWHIPDPVRFARNLRVTVQALGWGPDGTYQPLADDISSVAYWYQAAPGQAVRVLPPLEERYAG